jgi:hypothetical protein
MQNFLCMCTLFLSHLLRTIKPAAANTAAATTAAAAGFECSHY